MGLGVPEVPRGDEDAGTGFIPLREIDRSGNLETGKALEEDHLDADAVERKFPDHLVINAVRQIDKPPDSLMDVAVDLLRETGKVLQRVDPLPLFLLPPAALVREPELPESPLESNAPESVEVFVKTFDLSHVNLRSLYAHSG